MSPPRPPRHRDAATLRDVPATLLACADAENRYLDAVLALAGGLPAELGAAIDACAVEPSDLAADQAAPPSPAGDYRAGLRLLDASEQRVLEVFRGADTTPSFTVEGCTSFAWQSDHELVYVVDGAARRPARALRADLRDAAAAPLVLFDELDGRFAVRVHTSRCETFLLLTSESRESSEAHGVRRHQADAPLVCLQARRPGIRFDIDAMGDRFILRTNDGAAQRQVVALPVDASPATEPVCLVPPREGAYLAEVLVFEQTLALLYRELGSDVLRVWRRAEPGRAALPAIDLGGTPPVRLTLERESDYGGRELGVVVETLAAPWARFAVDLESGAARRTDGLAVAGFQADQLWSGQIVAPGHDGTGIPVSLVRARDAAGPQPTVLIVYGAYGASVPLGFSLPRLGLLTRGVTVAFAHVRGGGELGPAWHAGGRGLHKWTSFIDLVSVAEALVAEGVAPAGKIALWGTSAGGLTAAVACRLAPHLFCAAALERPFVEVLALMSDPTLPLTELEYTEWGDPRDPSVRRYIESYDPGLHLDGEHPHLLVSIGLRDFRVPAWSPMRWALGTRALGRGGVVLIKTEVEGGHGTRDLEAERDQVTLVHTFFLLAFAGRLDAL